MKSFLSLYDKLLKAGVNGRLESGIEDAGRSKEYIKRQLDCLLEPEKQPAVICTDECPCNDEEKGDCIDSCYFDAISKDEKGDLKISKEICVGCAECIEKCRRQNLTDRKELVPIFRLLDSGQFPVYAMIAPAYISQFSTEVTPGKLRSAFKKLGFTGMIEVALFADILTLKEALEFDDHIRTEKDFMLTSCCCPIWVAMIRKIYYELMSHMPPSISPMAACGRTIKILHPDAKTVFIGPCIAKKAESREKDITDAVDHVLTFQELRDIFDAAGIDLSTQEEDKRDHSSQAGRIYAKTTGVSEAVKDTLNRLRPDRSIRFNAKQADGAAACKKLLNDIRSGVIDANFIEGMGCAGGCIGGPKALIKKEESFPHVSEYAKSASYKTPVDNPFVMELLDRLGFDTIESLRKDNSIFTRDFRADLKEV